MFTTRIYILGLCAAALVALAVFFSLTGSYTPKQTVGTSRSWSNTPIQYSFGDNQNILVTSSENGSAYTYGTLPLFEFATSSSFGTFTDPSTGALENLRAYLSGEQTQNNTQSESFLDWFSFGGSSGITASSPNTPAQDEQYRTYGNAVGSIIEKIEAAQPAYNDAFDAFVENQNTTTAQGIAAFANTVRQQAGLLLAMSSVPADMFSSHTNLANAYMGVADALDALALTRDTDSLLAAIDTYSTPAIAAGEATVQMVLIFKLHSTTFTEGEPGYLFIFAGVGQ